MYKYRIYRDVPSRSRTEDLQRKREEWKRQQEVEMEHERLKRRKIKEWERKRAQELGKKSSSDSPSLVIQEDLHRINIYLGTSKKISSKSWFKGLEASPVSFRELCSIKVEIRRNIAVTGSISEIQRNICNPDDVIIPRTYEEGRKPIFDRTEIKRRAIEDEKKKYRTVIRKDQLDSETNKIQTSRKSLSPSSSNRRNRSKIYEVGEKNYTDIEENKRRIKRSRSKELKRNSHSRCDRPEKSCKHSRKSKDTERDRDRDRNKDRDRDSDKDEDRDSDTCVTWKDIKYNRPLNLFSAGSSQPYWNFPTSFPITGGGSMFPRRRFIVGPRRPFPHPVGPIRPPLPNPVGPIRLPPIQLLYRYGASNRM